MKKFILAVIGLLCTTAALFGTTASIAPEILIPSAFYSSLTITVTVDTDFANGEISVIIPDAFIPAPNLNPAGNGYVRVSKTSNDTTSAGIAINGNAVTITGVNLVKGDSIQIIYGAAGSGSYAMSAPSKTGVYTFTTAYRASNTDVFSDVQEQPSIEVTYMTLSKTASVSSVTQNTTFTYAIHYENAGTAAMSSVYIWDTLPEGLTYLGALSSSGITAGISGKVISFDLGTVQSSAGTAGNIYIRVSAAANIISIAGSLTNTASLSYVYGTGVDHKQSTAIVGVLGGRLLSTLTAVPAAVDTGNDITVVLGTQNTGNYQITNVQPAQTPVYTGTGSVECVQAPASGYIAGLASGATEYFTWLYKATGEGTGKFSCYASGLEDTTTIYSAAVNSDKVVISPAPTATITETVIPADTFTCTMTYTPTSTITPTATITTTSTPEPGENLVLDRNYVDVSKGEELKIKIKADQQGEKIGINIYNLSGERVRGIEFVSGGAGWNEVPWDIKNDSGKTVGQGMYFIRIKYNSMNVMRKVYVLK
jgi:uncharacterized repeat protein (TIGR01451 family)